jgi:MFS family permease
MRSLAVMCALWAAAWIVVLVGGLRLETAAAAAAFGLAAIVFGLGECFQGPVQGALVADLAPPRLRGRYMAVSTISWDIGFIVGPAVGGFVLQAEPLALWPLAAAVCLVAGAGAIALERTIPRDLRLTPA